MSDRRQFRVGLNLVFLTDRSAGAGRYVQELLPALLDAEPELRMTAFVGADAPTELLDQPWSGRVEWKHFPVTVTARTHLLAQMAAIPVVAARRGLDVIHSPANIGPLATPGAARVVTLLDVIWLHQGERWETGRAASAFARLSAVCARNAHRVLTISESARDDVTAALGLPDGKVDVAPLGVTPPPDGGPASAVEVRRRFELGERPLVLCVAQKRPYKNLSVLIRALGELDEPVLLLPGAPTEHEGALRSLARELGVEERVRFLSWVSEEELEGLYRAAACFVLPSLIEGFGLPVLEAMARDVPVACSDRPALPEVVGDAALLFDPEDQAAVTAAVRTLLSDPAFAARLTERGRERVRMFSWRRTAEATLASYRRAVADRGARR